MVIWIVGYLIVGLLAAHFVAPAYAEDEGDAELGGAICLIAWPLVAVFMVPMLIAKSAYRRNNEKD